MKVPNVKLYTALIPIVLSIFSLMFALTTSSKVPIRMTLTAPYFKFMVEINFDSSPSRLNFRQDAKETLIASVEQ